MDIQKIRSCKICQKPTLQIYVKEDTWFCPICNRDSNYEGLAPLY